jgi:diguanylate cyclase (GGDEF)-like protein
MVNISTPTDAQSARSRVITLLGLAAVAGGIGAVGGVVIGSAGLLGNAPSAGVVAGALLCAGGVGLAIGVKESVQSTVLKARVRSLEEVDQLTGLPTRKVFLEEIERLLRRGRSDRSRTSLIVVHVERLGEINHTHGREVGDQVVTALVARIRGQLGRTDKCYRLDGTHFAIVASDVGTSITADRLAERVMEPLGAAYDFDNELINAPACVGVVVSDDQGTNRDDLLTDAEAAIHRAVELGPGSLVRFEQSLVDRHLTPATAANMLERALEQGEFHLAYLPMRDARTAELVGVEALLRWMDEGRGVVAAHEFLPAMEESGLIVPVGEWVISEVCRQATYWTRTYPTHDPLPVTVNLSTREVAQRTFLDTLSNAIDDNETDPHQIVLEVKEQTLLADRDGPWTTLRKAKGDDVRLSLDNFGTGASSIATLRALNFDVLKIDRSFVEAVTVSPEDRAVVKNLVSLARDLGMLSVAEGISSRDQVQALAEMGCDQVQGHFVGKALAPGAVDDLLYRAVSGAEEPSPAAAPDLPEAPVTQPGPTEIFTHSDDLVTSGAPEGLPARTPGASGAKPEKRVERGVVPVMVDKDHLANRPTPRRLDLFGR